MEDQAPCDLETSTTSLPIPLARAMDRECAPNEEDRVKAVAFHRLPDEIIEQILKLTTPNSFASLILLNRKWRAVSQQAHLYAYHLGQCPSYRAAHRSNAPNDDEDSLPQLRRQFAHEIKRNLFEAYLRPREIVINLVSTSIGASSAPGGEAFQFSLSSKGHYILAYSSSRIHVIDVTGPEIAIKWELKILRRPASTTITDDGSLLAVLSTDLQVDLYNLTGEHPKHTRAFALDHAPRTITLSPTGSILAAAYDSGVEVSSLDPGASTDRRSVKCYAVDSLSFSRDGTQLLGTTLQSRNPSTVVLTAPYYNPGNILQEESVSALWTTSILFPNGSRDCSHAVLLPSQLDDEASWTFTYDRVFETFRAVRVDDLRNGTTYFTGPTAEFGSITHLLPSTLPTASDSGDLVAAGFQGSIWLYGVPEDLDASPNLANGMSSNVESNVNTPVSPLGHRNSVPSLHSINRQTSTNTSRTPQWQLLCDRFRNTFIEGRKITTLDGVSAMTWVSDKSKSHGERLVVVAPGVGSQSPINDDDGMTPTDGGRITILDFDYSITNGRKSVVTVEVGEREPEILEEEQRDMDTEVAIVRRRTVAQRRGNNGNVGRSTTTATRPAPPPVPSMPALHDLSDPFGLPTSLPRGGPSQPLRSTEQTENTPNDEDEEEEAFDAPYSQTNPRSGTTLRRAATAAALNRRLHPRAVAQDHIEYRRADGREEHPHESDADDWVPPPPPYSKDPLPNLPTHIQRSILAEATRNLHYSSTQRTSESDVFSSADLGSLHRSRTTFSASTSHHTSLHRTLSESTTRTRSVSIDDNSRPVTSPVSATFDDLYDVSPPGTPQPVPHEISRSQHIPRRPVGSGAASSSAFTPNPAMRATLQQPVSPIPQSAGDTLEQRIADWETTTMLEPRQTTPVDEGTSSSPSAKRLTRERIDQPLPPPPNEDHHLTSPPPTTDGLLNETTNLPKLQESPPQPVRSKTVPISAATPAAKASEGHFQLLKRSETTPVSSQIENRPLSPGLAVTVMPSADQLARLKSRTGRPPGRILANPAVRRSGSNPRERPPLSIENGIQSTSLYRSVSDPNLRTFAVPGKSTAQSTPTPPRAAVGAIGSHAASGSRVSFSNSPSHGRHPLSTSNSPSRQLSQNKSKYRNEPSSPDMRPPMARLETIRSVSSAGEPSPFVMNPEPMTLGKSQSRAESSAAKNAKDTRKRGWRASMWKAKTKTEGWTDINEQEKSGKRKEEKNGGKCIFM